MKVIHHNDPDGVCAAALIGIKYPNETIEYIAMDYYKKISFDLFVKDETVFIVDFSFSDIEDWNKLLYITKNVIWIDHHISAIEDKTYPYYLKGFRQSGISASMLTFKYLFQDIKPFYAIELINDYDLWLFKYGDITTFFNNGLYYMGCYPKNVMWDSLLINDKTSTSKIEEIIEIGKVITNYSNKQNWGITRNQSKHITWNDYKCIITNIRGSSQVFEPKIINDYDLLIKWFFNGKSFSVKISTEKDNIDISKLCKKYGGGGHQKVGGFECKNLPNIFLHDSFYEKMFNKFLQAFKFFL